MSPRSLVFLTFVALSTGACGEGEGGAPAIANPQVANRPEPTPAAPGKPTEAEASARSEAELADLEAMCAAVDHDYNDGTLSDYFKGLSSSTPWGKELQARADESTSPGRLLLAAARESGLPDVDPRAPACGRIFEYIDDVE